MKKVLSLILTLVMVFSLVPFTALATESEEAGSSQANPITTDNSYITSVSNPILYAGGVTENEIKNGTVTLKPTLTRGNAPTTDEEKALITWSYATEDDEVAVAVSNGEYTITAVKAGSATVKLIAEWSVTTTTGTGDSATSTTKYYKETKDVTVTVRTLDVTDIVLGQGEKLTVTNTSGGTITMVEKEDASNCISINYSKTEITASKAGTAVVTVKLDGGKLTKDVNVNVIGVDKVQIFEGDTELKLTTPKVLGFSDTGYNGTMTLTAAVTPSTAVDEGVQVKWTSNKTAVATVEDGVVTFVAPGETTITATAGNKSSSFKLQLIGIKTLNVEDTFTMVLGGEKTLTATLTTTSGYKVKWASNSDAVATVNETTGKLVATGIGSTTITAILYKTVSGVDIAYHTKEVTVTVTPLELTYTTSSAALSMSSTDLMTQVTTSFRNVHGSAPASSATYTVAAIDTSGGTLRYSGNTAVSATPVNLTASQFASLYFVPKTYGGTYSFVFTVTSGDKTLEGRVTLGAGYQAAEIQVSLTSTAQTYAFSSGAYTNENIAVSSAISSYVLAAARSASYIRFTSLGTSGVLYTDSNMTEAVKTNTNYDFYWGLSSMVLRPGSGSWTAEYTVYDAYDLPIVSGKIRVGASVSLEYRTTAGGTVFFQNDDFQALWKQSYPTGALSYVTFAYPGISTYYGTISNNGTPLTDVTAGLTKLYLGTTGTGALASASYTAPSTSVYGYDKYTLQFTLYGYTGSSYTLQEMPGALTVYVTKNAVSDVTYTTPVGNAKALSKADFYTMVNYALGSVNSNWTISFDELPAETNGVLLSYYSSNTYFTKAVAGQEYYYSALDDFRFVPYTNYSGTVTIPFTISIGSEKVIKSNLVIKVGEGYTYASASEGVNMKLETFYNSSASDPVAHISFKQPDKGTLYYNYTASTGVEVSELDFYYTVPSLVTVTKALPLTSVKYVPEANQSGDVTIEYTAYTTSGQKREGSIVIRVVSKTVSSQFKDVTSTYKWAADSVDFMFHYGIVKGQDTAMTQFGPAGKMSRGDLVLILYRLAGAPSVYGVSNPFTDVKAADYYYNAVMWAYQNGVVDGISAKQFAPTGDVTRQQIAAILYRYETKVLKNTATGMKAFTGYTDASKVQSYAIAPMQWAVGNGYITGTTTTTLDPASNATRAQVAVMLHRYLTY